MIDPRTVDLSALPSVPLEKRSQLPTSSAIYFAIDAVGAVQYIGRSVNVRHRWAEHHRYEKLKALGEIRISYLQCEPDLLPAVEEALIEWFNPPLNGFREFTAKPKKPAKRQNYKISYTLLAGLKGVATLEDRSDTAQLERWIREGIDKWRLENPGKTQELDALISEFLASEGAENED